MFLALLFGGFVVLMLLAVWKMVTRKSSYLSYDEEVEFTPSEDALINTLVNEINTALSLGQKQVVHTLTSTEPEIDGTIAAMITFRVSMATPCAITFNFDKTSVVEINLEKMEY